MNWVDSIRLMVRHVDGGWDAMGILCGKSGETLRHAFSGKDSRYVPSLHDAETISEACIRQNSQHCRAFVNAVQAHGNNFLRLEVRDTMAVDALRSDIASVVKEAADVLIAGTSGLADGHVCDNDHRATSLQLQELIQAAQKAQADLDAAHRAGKLRAVA